MDSRNRPVVAVVDGRFVSEGAGVRIRRTIGSPELDMLDPFLLLDEFKSDSADDYLAGFPDHPHRGFETVTYMLAGNMQHRDHMGNQGDLGPGSVQWMTAGRGIIHSEMPRQERGLMWGFQLWVNLPSDDKMCEPRYQDIPPDAVPDVALDGGGKVRVLAGQFGDVQGAVSGIATSPTYLHVELPAGGAFEHALPSTHNAVAYIFDGGGAIGEGGEGDKLSAGKLAVLGDGDTLHARAGEQGMQFLLLAGRPLAEPVARYGPFVMNTRDEIMQAVRDYQQGKLLG